MSKLFISHSSEDDAFVGELRSQFTLIGGDVWIDSRELRGGDPLWETIQEAIEAAEATAVVVSPDGLQSTWVGKEMEHAIKAGKRVIPLLLNGTELGVLKGFFGDDEPICVSVSSEPGGAEAAIHDILVALGIRSPSDTPAKPQPKAEPIEELVLNLSDFKFHEEDGIRRASARAQLVYEPAEVGKESIVSEKWRLVAPLGPIETEDLRWYLEKYAIWPSEYFKERASKVEANLIEWGRHLHEAAMPKEHVKNVSDAWIALDGDVRRRFSVHVDTVLEADSSEEEEQIAKEASTLLLGLPWELLHDDKSFLFQGGKPTRVRRRLPSTESFPVPVVAPPIRILLVTARPEDESCGYIDHRASSKPLVDAIETLGGLVELTLLSPPTLSALRDELDRQHYHVVHFDGHGVYDRHIGLGGLCFEDPDDTDKLTKRAHKTIFTDELGPLLRDHRIPLVILEACQTAQAEEASESVASELLKVGVASVVAMSHSVLVETARRFVQQFYGALAQGKRVGDAMLAGQRALKNDTVRGRVFGLGEFTLEDWFVPVLFQEKEDPQLFTATPAKQTQDDIVTMIKARLGNLPNEPETGFVGRSRDLLALERLLRGGPDRYAVIRGQGGEGKTALAAEFGRWMVRSQQIERAAFLSVETHSHAQAVLHALGLQLVGEKFTATEFEPAVLEIERALTEQTTLLVIDNMESVLLPPFVAEETPEALSEDARRELASILSLCQRLHNVGDTRLIFTSREALPEPFDAQRNRRELQRLAKEDAVKLVERTLQEAGAGATSNAKLEAIEELVDAVHGHARTLALLAPSLRSQGVEVTRQSLVELMTEMEEIFPGNREHSVFATVELSLRRMSEANRKRVKALSVFHGGFHPSVLKSMMDWTSAEVVSLAKELGDVGLATADQYAHITLNPALCPYIRRQSTKTVDKTFNRWVKAQQAYVGSLEIMHSQDYERARLLTVSDLTNIFALMEHLRQAGEIEASLSLNSSLLSLLQMVGKPGLLERLEGLRNQETELLDQVGWNHVRVNAEQDRILQLIANGNLGPAVANAKNLLTNLRSAGEDAYPEATLDLAKTYWILGQAIGREGGWEEALMLLHDARNRFESLTEKESCETAEYFVLACFSEQGRCLAELGRYEQAISAYEESIQGFLQNNNERGVAVGKFWIGNIRLMQSRPNEALKAYTDALPLFNRIGEPGTLSQCWHQTGAAYEHSLQPEAAEEAYRKSLAIKVQLRDSLGQANTLGQLGNLYSSVLERPEESISFFRQAVNKFAEVGSRDNECLARQNLSDALRKLRRFDEARKEIRRAIECKELYGHAATLWRAWAILAYIEIGDGNPIEAAEAKKKAIDLYLAYRRDGGEDHSPSGRLFHAVTEALQAGNQTAAEQAIAAFRERFPDSPAPAPLEVIANGSRDLSLAEAPELHYTAAAEIFLLIETLS